MIKNKKNIFKIKGDASFREFYRKKQNRKSSIIVHCKKEKNRNLVIYDAINKLLNKNNILAPKLYNHNLKKNIIEIQDFGDRTVYNILKKKKKNKKKIFQDIIYLLKKIQSIKQTKVKNFENNIYKIPKYSNTLLLKEAKLFCDWYVPSYKSKKKAKIINKKLIKIFKFLLSKLKNKNDTFVHRDFHVSNLIYTNQRYALIDTQDAVIGNKAYDLASLIDDVRVKISNELKLKIFHYYLKINSQKIDYDKIKNDFVILSILRNMKIIGIFTRLAKRDKKIKYLNLIPYTWKLIDLRLKNNHLLQELKIFLNKNFSKKVRKKYEN